MCDPVLIAAIPEELGYFDEKEENGKNDEIRDEGSNQDSLQNSREE